MVVVVVVVMGGGLLKAFLPRARKLSGGNNNTQHAIASHARRTNNALHKSVLRSSNNISEVMNSGLRMKKCVTLVDDASLATVDIEFDDVEEAVCFAYGLRLAPSAGGGDAAAASSSSGGR